MLVLFEFFAGHDGKADPSANEKESADRGDGAESANARESVCKEATGKNKNTRYKTPGWPEFFGFSESEEDQGKRVVHQVLATGSINFEKVVPDSSLKRVSTESTTNNSKTA